MITTQQNNNKSITVVQQHCKNKNKPQLGTKVLNEQLGNSPLRKHCSKHASRTGAVNN